LKQIVGLMSFDLLQTGTDITLYNYYIANTQRNQNRKKDHSFS